MELKKKYWLQTSFAGTLEQKGRPVIVPAPEFSNDLLLFSSNRPGGAGGYDLYYAGVDR